MNKLDVLALSITVFLIIVFVVGFGSLFYFFPWTAYLVVGLYCASIIIFAVHKYINR